MQLYNDEQDNKAKALTAAVTLLINEKI